MDDSLVNALGGAYAGASSEWLTRLLPIAQRLFLALATIEIAWSGIRWALADRAGENLLGRLLLKVMGLMVFYTLLLFAPSWMATLISSFARAGEVASGQPHLDPGTIAQQGVDLTIALFDDAGGLLSLLTLPIWVNLAALFVALAFAAIAAMLLSTLIESYLVIGAGVLLLGFTGSRWTVTFADGYLVYAVRVGVKLFLLYLLIGVGMSFPIQWLEALQAGPFSSRALLEVLGGSMIFAFLVFKVPNTAAAMLGPNASFRLERAYVD